MPFQEKDGIIFVPGLFGFGSFGPTDAPVLQYFRQVAVTLEQQKEVGSLAGRHLFHEPPPTGPLSARVDSLAKIIDEILVVGFPKSKFIPERLHLIGHSTGGLDIRLLLNERYNRWGGPTASEKAALRERVASAVTISSPLRGAPFAARMGPAIPQLMVGLNLLSILGTPLRLPGFPWRRRITLLVGRFLASSLSLLHPSLPNVLMGALAPLGEPTVSQIRRFIQHIREDHRLFRDLEPYAMESLNDHIQEGDTFPLRHIVTASPPPGFFPALLPRRVLYQTAYRMARPWSAQRSPFPQGAWIAPTAEELASDTANDGVVPSSSQVLPTSPQAPWLLKADHLDVVGHFEGIGETFFDSGADMDLGRFKALWRTVARVL